jgi:hypothetical protein
LAGTEPNETATQQTDAGASDDAGTDAPSATIPDHEGKGR